MPHAENQLITEYLPLVRRLAWQLLGRLPANVELDDLIQAGLMGLLDAVRRYEQTADAQFETYATTRIRGAMLDELRSQDWLPRSVRTKARAIEAAVVHLNQTLMRAPSEAEIAAEMGLALPEYQHMLEEAHGVQLLHYEDLGRDRDEDAGHALEYAVVADGHKGAEQPFGTLVSREFRAALVQAITQLPEREKLLLSLQFEQDLTQKEIAVVMGVSEGRVSQLRSQAVVRLRATLADSGWQEKPLEAEDHVVL